MTRPPTLTPEMLLFEVACMLSRHGIPASSRNPGAAVTAATRLLQALGVIETPAIEAAPDASTAVMPLVPRGPDNGRPPRVHTLDRPFRFDRGRAELRSVDGGGHNGGA